MSGVAFSTGIDLTAFDRKTLQALAKQHGVKANLSNAKIIEELEALARGDAAAVAGTAEKAIDGGRSTIEDTGLQNNLTDQRNIEEVIATIATIDARDCSPFANLPVCSSQRDVIEINRRCGGNTPSVAVQKFFSPGHEDLIRKRSLSPFVRGRGKTPIKLPLSQISMKSDNSLSETYEFKPKPMPDFKALHAKLPHHLASRKNERIVKKANDGS